MRARTNLGSILSAALLALAAAGWARADIVRLKGGGKVEGKIISTENGRINIRTVAGTLTFPAVEAEHVEYRPTPQEEYARRETAVDRQDTAALILLADWCATVGLRDRESALLEAVLGLDPDHPEARQRLGYVRVGEAWMTPADALRARGLVQYGYRWVTPEERDRLAREDLAKRLEERWLGELAGIVARLESGNPRRQREALDELRHIKDPLAIGPLVKTAAGTDGARTRATLVAALGQFQDDRAVDALIDVCLVDGAADVRQAAIDVLVALDDPRVPGELARALDEDSWTLKLRACYALGELRAFEAVPALIRNLTTIEGSRTEVSWAWRRGGLSHFGVGTYVPTYRQWAGGAILVIEPVIEGARTDLSLRAASPQWKEVTRRRAVRSLNSQAWAALVKIAGQDFGYYEDHWWAWYQAAQRARRRAHRENSQELSGLTTDLKRLIHEEGESP